MINSEKKEMKKEDPRRHNHTAEIFENKMYIFGGCQGLKTGAMNELWVMDLGKGEMGFLVVRSL